MRVGDILCRCLLAFACLLYCCPVLAAMDGGTAPSVAFFYGTNPPLDELKAFDIVVVEPDAVGIAPKEYRTAHSELFAYVSVGEIDPVRSYFKNIDPRWIVAENAAWKSKVVDLSNPEWRRFLLDRIIEPLWKAGYRGFFLDTLDSYHLVKDRKRDPAMASGLAEIIREIKRRHPEARLIMNRGFEVLERVKDVAFAVAAESLFRNFNPSTGRYGEVPENDRRWLLGRFAEVKKAGLPVIAIDYVDPSDRDLTRKTAQRIKELGFIPWVTDRDLTTLGVGSVEVLPRRILGVFEHTDKKSLPDPMFSDLNMYVSMPLNYLGYRLELHNIAKPLPQGALAGRYAGIIVAATGGEHVHKDYQSWVLSRIKERIPVVFLDGFGVDPERRFLGELGLQRHQSRDLRGKVEIVTQDPLTGFEQPVPPSISQTLAITAPEGTSLLTVSSAKKVRSDVVALTTWGGYALAPFVYSPAFSGQRAWLIDPFRFLTRALRLPQMPAPDVTTENGVRLLLSHIDADGFESMAEWPGGRLAGVELREHILKKYPVPITMSVITGILDEKGIYPEKAALYQQEMREIFRIPWIEAGSHTYSHPFYWQSSEANRATYKEYHLNIPGYRFSLNQEIEGSIDFINKKLLPPGKRVTMLQWSGDCMPSAETLRHTNRAGVRNINGGDTLITETRRSLTNVAPIGIEKEGAFQVFAPNQNENVYTNDWTGPFYGYRRIIETFRMTDSPRRLKPVNIYYHAYSASKLASLKALTEAYDWAMKQQLFPVYTSAYVDKVLDYNRTVIARQEGGWLLRNNSDLRQLRMASADGYPDLAESRGVIGFSNHGDQRYIHLAPGGNALLRMTAKAPQAPYLSALAARLDRFEKTASGMRLDITAHGDGYARFTNAAGCRVLSSGKIVVGKTTENDLSVRLTMGRYPLELVCK